MLASASDWYARRSWSAQDFSLPELMAAKRQRTVSVVLPAHNEEATVGGIVAAICRDLVPAGLVDEVLVVDSGSTDGTARVAAAAGARVVGQADVLAEQGDRPGKGEALWKAVAAADGEFVVFLDADVVSFVPGYVVGLLGPLLTEPAVAFVKATYDRPLAVDGRLTTGGGRVTELLARPLLNAFWPELAGFVQPLAGEYAARRDVLEQVPFAPGYGVELGLLVDLLDLVGLDALAQVDLGRREHAHQSDEALGRMASQVLLTAWRRLASSGRAVAELPATSLTQFARAEDGRLAVTTSDIEVADRPPLARLSGYRPASSSPSSRRTSSSLTCRKSA